MRFIGTLLLLSLFSQANAFSQTPPAAQAQAAVKPGSLKVGDAAPFIKDAKYLTGSEVSKFEKDKVYVVEFWATWCGPCIQAMPHLAELQAEYKDQGLVVVGVTSKDPRNSELQVKDFVEKRGRKLGYTFAFCDNDETNDAFMTASGQEGIPCSFVVDQAGKVAYIGHPMSLDDILPRVIAKTWKGKADLDEIEKANEELHVIFSDEKLEPANKLKKVDDYLVKYPFRKSSNDLTFQRIVLNMKSKNFDAAKLISEEILKKATATKSIETMAKVSAIWAYKGLNTESKYTELATSTFAEMLKIEGDKDLQILLHGAEIYFELGDKAKALELSGKALQNATAKDEKDYIEKIIAKFKGETTEPKK